MTISRRALLGAGIAAIGSLAAGCAHALRAAAPTSATATGSGGTSAATVAPKSAVATAGRSATARPVPVSGPAVEYAHGPRTRPQVALTFHGAGDPGIARELLAIFAAHQAKVTVLAVGTWLAANPGIAAEIVAGGHELGNHTYSHLDLDSLDEAAARAEIVRCRDLLLAQVGSAGAHFRQSQAQHSTPLVRSLAGAAGYRVCLSYDIDSLDYTDPGPDAIRRNVATAQPGSVVSMHFGHPGTVTAMPAVLSGLAGRGLQPVTATTVLRP